MPGSAYATATTARPARTAPTQPRDLGEGQLYETTGRPEKTRRQKEKKNSQDDITTIRQCLPS
jgi:hypothetical protein